MKVNSSEVGYMGGWLKPVVKVLTLICEGKARKYSPAPSTKTTSDLGKSIFILVTENPTLTTVLGLNTKIIMRDENEGWELEGTEVHT